MLPILSPSLLSADFSNLAHETRLLEHAGITWLHLDVMDGHFVPNITFGAPVISALRKCCNLFFDAHLMIENPENYIGAYVKSGADLVVCHLETMRHPQRCMSLIRELGCRSGIALDPDTRAERLRWLLPDIDLVLIMGVNPGFSGQKYIPVTARKTRECRKFLDNEGFMNIPIQIDGGVSPLNAAELIEAGADVLVSGSAFFKEKDYALGRKVFEEAMQGAMGNREEVALARVASWRHNDVSC